MCCKYPFGDKSLAFFFEFRSLPYSGHQEDPKRHFLHRKHVFWAVFDLRWLCSGCARAQERIKNRKQLNKGTQKCIISRCGDATCNRDYNNFQLICERNRPCKIGFRGFGSRFMCQNCGSHIEKGNGPTNVCCTIVRIVRKRCLTRKLVYSQQEFGLDGAKTLPNNGEFSLSILGIVMMLLLFRLFLCSTS